MISHMNVFARLSVCLSVFLESSQIRKYYYGYAAKIWIPNPERNDRISIFTLLSVKSQSSINTDNIATGSA